jgi:hypothetical protein
VQACSLASSESCLFLCHGIHQLDWVFGGLLH